MKPLPAKLMVLPFVGLAALALVCSPQPGALPPPAETDPEAKALAEPIPDILRALLKNRLAHEVANGRRSLLEAAALFGALNELPPEAKRADRVDSRVNIPV